MSTIYDISYMEESETWCGVVGLKNGKEERVSGEGHTDSKENSERENNDL